MTPEDKNDLQFVFTMWVLACVGVGFIFVMVRVVTWGLK